MTGQDYITELQARGFDYITPTSRLLRWVNFAYHRINGGQAWRFLRKRTVVTTPATISDLRAVLQAADAKSGYPVTFEDIRTIRERGLVLVSGSPTSWFLDENGDFAVWPENSTREIDVLYIRSVPDIDESTSPVWPDRFHYTLVEGGAYYAYRDSDNFEAAAECAAEVDRGVAEMAQELLVPNFDVPRSIDPGPWATSSVDW